MAANSAPLKQQAHALIDNLPDTAGASAGEPDTDFASDRRLEAQRLLLGGPSRPATDRYASAALWAYSAGSPRW
ncbi:MAG: hypothetical protein ACREUL_10990 [Steroidobacteraceae bacterium]